MVCRDLKPRAEDRIDALRAEAHQYHDELIALGGRSTRPIKQYPDCGSIVKDGKRYYRDEYEKIEAIFEFDKDRALSHWAEEMNRCGLEMRTWQIFKEDQQVYDQNGRSELELELENTDPALVGALRKLNDWQEFECMHQKEVHQAERFLEKCQQGNAKTHNALVDPTYSDLMSDLMFERQEPIGMREMRDAQGQLDVAQIKLMWVKSQWKEVIAEACSLIKAAPRLQEQLEAKFEKQTRAVYRTLQQQGARPSHAVNPPDKDVEFPHRLQHWISESSAFFVELRDWSIFMSWRERMAGILDRDGRQVLSEVDSCSKIFEDLVEYQQYELKKALSWVESWRVESRWHFDSKRSLWSYERSSTSCGGLGWPHWGQKAHVDDDDDDDDSSDDEDDLLEAKRAEFYAMNAEDKVSVAAKRLEEAKQKLQDILAEASAPCTSQKPPTSLKSPSPEGLRKLTRFSKQKGSSGSIHRRSKKEIFRKREANMVNANTEQRAPPQVSLNSEDLNKDDEDTQMSNYTDDPEDSEDAVMSDAVDCPDLLPPCLPESYPRPIPQIDHTNVPSSSSPSPISRRTRSATKLDQVPSGRILKRPNKTKTTKKAKVFTEQQQMALLSAAATEHPTAAPTSLGGVEQNPYPTPPTSTHSSQSSSPPSSRPTSSRKTRPAKELNRLSPGKIHKNSNKDKPRKKAKAFTEEQTQMLLHAATSSCHSTAPTSPGKTVTENSPNHHASVNKDTIPSSGSPSLTSKETLSTPQLDEILSSKPHKDPNQNKTRKKAKNLTGQQTPALTNAASAHCPLTSSSTLRRSERLKQKAAAGKQRA